MFDKAAVCFSPLLGTAVFTRACVRYAPNNSKVIGGNYALQPFFNETLCYIYPVRPDFWALNAKLKLGGGVWGT